MNDETKEPNSTVVPFSVVTNDRDQESADSNDQEFTYSLTDVDDVEHIVDGFVIFTSSHVAVMTETKPGLAIPVFLLPLTRLKQLELLTD